MPKFKTKAGFNSRIDSRATSVVNSALASYSTTSQIVASFAPISHSHGNITNEGRIGTTANLPLITTTGGAVTVGSFGTSANTFCQGNDSRLSDARTPLAHNQAWSTITDTPTTLIGYGITDAQPLDGDLTAIAALSSTGVARRTGTNTWDLVPAARTDITNTFAATQLLQAAATGTTSLLRMINSNSGQRSIFQLEAPGWQIAFQTNPANGWFEIASSGGAIQHRWFEQNYIMASGGRLYWSSETNYASAGISGQDCSIGRSGFDRLRIFSAVGGDGDLSLRSITMSGPHFLGVYTVATLPSAGSNAGGFAQVTDSNSTTNGNTVAGGGANRVPVFSNGTNWIIK